MISFDAEHFLHIVKFGYTHEKEHAFFPGYPMLLEALRSVTDGVTLQPTCSKKNKELDLVTQVNEVASLSDAFFLLAFTVQITLGALNCYLIYQLGMNTLTSSMFVDKNMITSRAHEICIGAAILFAFNSSLIYSITLYSETTFTTI